MRAGSAITASPTHSRRVARRGWTLLEVVVCFSLWAIAASSNGIYLTSQLRRGRRALRNVSARPGLAKVRDQAVAYLDRKRLVGEASERAGDHPQLLEVLGAAAAGVEVALEPARLGLGQD